MSFNTARYLAVSNGMKTLFDEAVRGYSPIFPDFCYEVDSDGESEDYAKTGGLKGMEERLGEIRYDSMRSALWSAENKEYANGVEAEKNALDDDRHGVYKSLIPKMGVEAMAHPDELLFDQMNNVETLESWDGQNLVDTDHEWGDSGAQSNELTYNVADTADPTDVECRAVFEKALNAILNYVNDKGKRFYRPTAKPISGIALIVPTLHLEQVFTDALFSSTKTDGAQNLLVNKPSKVQYLPQLSSSTKLLVMKLDVPAERPFLFQRRTPLQRWTKGAEDPEARSIKFGCNTRYVMVPNAWWNIAQIELT
ncbi:MAG: Mu-like prophage major head subunit gpT family protein [Planctomycetaceae bacterium]